MNTFGGKMNKVLMSILRRPDQTLFKMIGKNKKHVILCC